MLRALPALPDERKPWLLLLGGMALLGLAIRIAAARGDYWLDEAWSAVYARDAATPGRVFFAINHDNNHYLNTLWLQAVGWGASPLWGRALSIACGAATVAVAGLIAARRGLIAAGLTATLLAVSPILVTYGSEARGYAPMLLALFVAVWIVDRELFGAPLRRAPEWLGLATLLGMLSHVSMLFGVAALIGWVAIEQKRRSAWVTAAVATVNLTGRMIIAVIAALLLVMVGAMASPTGFRMGILTGFAWPDFTDALAHMLAFTLGWPLHPGAWLLPLLLMPLLLLRLPALRDRAPFHFIAIIGLPLLVALLRPDNAAIPRYYLLSAVALLLLVADLLAAARPLIRYAVVPLIFAGCLTVDFRILLNQRADPGIAVRKMQARSPNGATVLIDEARDSAVLETSAAVHRYGLRTVEDCRAPAAYLFAANTGSIALPPAPSRCGAIFLPIAEARHYGLSGMAWRLYERAR